MKWKPNTHNIVFEIEPTENGIVCLSFVSDEYEGNPQEVFEIIHQENQIINNPEIE